MEHQYPGAISGDENMLAELMLPDQAHMRKEDWTIFFLHKDTSESANSERNEDPGGKMRNANEEAGPDVNEKEQPREVDGEADTPPETIANPEEELEGGEGPPLIYVLNLVNTKQDNSVKRCALVAGFK